MDNDLYFQYYALSLEEILIGTLYKSMEYKVILPTIFTWRH